MPSNPCDEVEDAYAQGRHASEIEHTALLANLDSDVARLVQSPCSLRVREIRPPRSPKVLTAELLQRRTF